MVTNIEIKKLKTQWGKKKVRGLALDIDNVLADTTVYFITKMYNRFGSYNGMTLKEMSLSFRYIRDVPNWQHEAANLYMKELIHSKQSYLDLLTVPNAGKTVQKISKIIPIACYITTRPNNILQATEKWLRKHEFPKVPIIARPDYLALNKRGKWKAQTLDFLSPEISGIIDDDPETVENLPKNYKGTFFLYNYDKNPRPDLDVHLCKAWKDVYSEIMKLHK